MRLDDGLAARLIAPPCHARLTKAPALPTSPITPDPDLPRIAVLATGGTIASSKDRAGVTRPTLSGQDLLAGLPLRDVAVTLVPRDVMAKDSSGLTLADMQVISDGVGRALADPEIAGVVVLHGTDAMEETAMLLHLQHRAAKPVIMTGAQFASDHALADGAANLADAIACAVGAAPGVQLAFGAKVLPVWGLYKARTDAADAFAQADSGAADGPELDLPRSVAGVRVDCVAIHPGADATHLMASLDAGAQGIVLAGLGSGNASAAIVAGVARAHAAGIPVVVSSRVPQGALAPVYGGGGGGHDLARAGAVHARILRPGQARILLAALIANDSSAASIAAAFA